MPALGNEGREEAMRYMTIALALASVILCGCGPYKVGDCIQLDYEGEAWESPDPIQKVIGIGKTHYRTAWLTPHGSLVVDGSANMRLGTFRQVPCPEILDRAVIQEVKP